ncbi:unnamed protein product [Owenia fusiformis]|uniref:Uncharacterized protein n=1 Tax=Owenia fusiformis TaxID=6347 RepID=A0A8S4QCJ8_OWEFU|nr:unnamed protein product [Owenia fusiformis]
MVNHKPRETDTSGNVTQQVPDDNKTAEGGSDKLQRAQYENVNAHGTANKTEHCDEQNKTLSADIDANIKESPVYIAELPQAEGRTKPRSQYDFSVTNFKSLIENNRKNDKKNMNEESGAAAKVDNGTANVMKCVDINDIVLETNKNTKNVDVAPDGTTISKCSDTKSEHFQENLRPFCAKIEKTLDVQIPPPVRTPKEKTHFGDFTTESVEHVLKATPKTSPEISPRQKSCDKYRGLPLDVILNKVKLLLAPCEEATNTTDSDHEPQKDTNPKGQVTFTYDAFKATRLENRIKRLKGFKMDDDIVREELEKSVGGVIEKVREEIENHDESKLDQVLFGPCDTGQNGQNKTLCKGNDDLNVQNDEDVVKLENNQRSLVDARKFQIGEVCRMCFRNFLAWWNAFWGYFLAPRRV